MKGQQNRNQRRAYPVWIAALAVLLIAPAALADDWDDDDYYDDHYYDNDDPYYGNGYGSSWDYYANHSLAGWSPYEVIRFDSLAGHGRWRWVQRAGRHLWFPYVASSWRPYYYGHWIHTSHGMTWVSYESWGDVPHHYGQWVFVDHLGWGWVPGYDYAPAWVTWGVVDGYVGWAPLPPHGYRYARHHRYRPGRHHVDYRFGGSFEYHTSGLDFSLWIFVNDRDFYGSSVYSCAVPVDRTLSLFKSKKVLPVGRNLHVDYVRKVSKRKIETVHVDRRTKKFGGRETVFHEPRGQSDKVRRGQEITKKAVMSSKVRRGDTELRSKPDAPVKRAPAKVWTQSDRDDDRRKVAAVERTRERTRQEKSVKERPVSQREAVSKQPTVKRERREAVTKQPTVKREQREAVTKQPTVKRERREAVTKQPTAKRERREAVTKQPTAKRERREAVTKQPTAKRERREAVTKQPTAKREQREAVTKESAAKRGQRAESSKDDRKPATGRETAREASKKTKKTKRDR